MEYSNILSGLKNYMLKSEEIEELASERMEICKKCQPNNHTKCEECGCLLSLKTRSPKSSCPLKKWKAKEI